MFLLYHISHMEYRLEKKKASKTSFNHQHIINIL